MSTPHPPGATAPRFPGGTSVSDLAVYPWETEDHLQGGSPHLHTVSTEAYVVIAGTGEVHTLSADGLAVDPLQRGSLLWFSPGTVHRLVNHESLQIAVVMSNAGLPEAGDAVLTFPREVLVDPTAYAAAAVLPDAEDEMARGLAARRRRDLAVEGYGHWRAEVERRGPEVLAELHQLAGVLVQDKVQAWQQLWAETVQAETELTRRRLEALAAGDPSHLAEATVVRGAPRPGPRGWGMCGRLQVWDAPTPVAAGHRG